MSRRCIRIRAGYTSCTLGRCRGTAHHGVTLIFVLVTVDLVTDSVIYFARFLRAAVSASEMIRLDVFRTANDASPGRTATFSNPKKHGDKGSNQKSRD